MEKVIILDRNKPCPNPNGRYAIVLDIPSGITLRYYWVWGLDSDGMIDTTNPSAHLNCRGRCREGQLIQYFDITTDQLTGLGKDQVAYVNER